MSSRNNPVWLRLDVVLAIHEAQIAQHGGVLGIRDIGLLESAVSRPQQAFAYSSVPPHVGILAALYALGVIKNHPFIDGNKRAGLVLLESFLALNGAQFTTTDEDCYRAIMAAAAGEMDDDTFCAWVKQNTIADEKI